MYSVLVYAVVFETRQVHIWERDLGDTLSRMETYREELLGIGRKYIARLTDKNTLLLRVVLLNDKSIEAEAIVVCRRGDEVEEVTGIDVQEIITAQSLVV